MKSYRDLIVWQRGVELVKEVYLLTDKLPATEKFGLISQIRRASVSIPANIAEGYARKHNKEYIQFLRIAFGSGAEIETYFVLLEELGFIKESDMEKSKKLLEEVMKMLNKLIAALVAKP